MKYLVDAKGLFEAVAAIPEAKRGEYITTIAMNLYNDKIVAPWISKVPKPKSAAMVKLQGGYSEPFELFWAEYPKKLNKANAYTQWKKQCRQIPEAELLKRCLNALLWQRNLHDWRKDDGTYIPYPETYLTNQRWQEKPPAAVTRPRVLTMDGTWA